MRISDWSSDVCSSDLFDLYDTVESTIALLAPLAYEKDLELVRIVYHDVPRGLRGDNKRLRQILTNLLSHAITYTERGAVVLISEESRVGKECVSTWSTQWSP